MDIRHVFRLSNDRRDLAEKMAESDTNGNIELAESLRPTLKRAIESLKLLYNDDDVWQAAADAAVVVKVPTRQLVQLVPNYQLSLPALLELFGYLAPPPADQLVNDAVRSLQAVPANEGPADRINAVNEARQALGQLLERTLDLETARPWRLPVIASETIPALDMGVQVAAGAATGAVGAALGAAAGPAAAATGGLAVAPMLILGGIYRWLRKKKVREQNEKLLEARKELSLDLVPAARAAVLQHLDAIVELAQCTVESAQAVLDLSDHLQALLDITRLFGASNLHLRAKARAEMDCGYSAFNFHVLTQMPEVFNAARKAKASLDASGQIGQPILAELAGRLKVIKNLKP